MAIQLASKSVVGRDRLIEQIWKMLRKNSIVFTAERRIGKTTVMQKMEAETPIGIRATYLDLEKIDTPHRFVEVLVDEVKDLLPKTRKARNAFAGLLNSLDGMEIGGVVKIPSSDKKDWQPALEKTLACVCEHHGESMILFLFDELPYMLQKISIREKKEGNQVNSALAILDSLRAIRAEQGNLRMIYSGSIGLHHVIDSLRGNEYATQPLNEMETVEIGSLDRSDAEELTKRLLDEEEVECENKEAVVNAIVEQTDCVPFYIERLINRFVLANKVITSTEVQKQVQFNLTDDNDHWEMEHFRTRIPTYYPESIEMGDRIPLPKATVVSKILDILSVSETPQGIDEICAGLKAELPLEDRMVVVQLLKNLSMDHYLISDEQKNYSFRFPLIQKWWKLAQGLSL
jgi:AAA+ ATPase superfamily predicted ATPase